MQNKILSLQSTLIKRTTFRIAKERLFFFSTNTGPQNPSTNAAPPPTPTHKKTLFQKFFGPETYTASQNFKKRWLMVLPCFLSNLCIGSPYAWSIVAGQLIRENGFVASSALDWTLAQATLPLSIVLFTMGASSALFASLQIKYGTRATMALGSLLFGGGMILGSLGIAMHQLWLLYLGYGLVSGCALGIAYTPPLQVLIEWFPDRKGLASGLAVGGFSCGAIVFTPVFQYLSQKFQKLPEYAGSLETVKTVTQNGRMYIEQSGGMREVILANSADLLKFKSDLMEGFYFVGTGCTGSAAALATYGALCATIMLTSSFLVKRPAAGFLPDGYKPPSNISETNKPESRNVHVDVVMKTPQYWFLISSVYFLGTGSLGIFSVAKPMMQEVFGSSLPTVVNATFASAFVLLLSTGNLLGRILWGLLSDKIGRRATFMIFTFSSIPLYLCLPSLVGGVVTYHSLACLAAFVGASVLSISMMGGAYAILPAYEADLFGSKYVGPIHGRFMLVVCASSLSGPPLLLYLRKISELNAIKDLLSKVDPQKFKEFFGTDIAHCKELIEAKTVNINSLMKIMPEQTQNPTPFLYDTTLYAMGGMMALAAVTHYMVRPVNPKYFEPREEVREEKGK